MDESLLLVVDNKNDSYELFEGSIVFGIYSNIEIIVDIYPYLRKLDIKRDNIWNKKNSL